MQLQGIDPFLSSKETPDEVLALRRRRTFTISLLDLDEVSKPTSYIKLLTYPILKAQDLLSD